MTIDQAKSYAESVIRLAGYTPVDSWATDIRRRVECSSVETYGPSTFNHPKAYLQMRLQPNGAWLVSIECRSCGWLLKHFGTRPWFSLLPKNGRGYIGC